MKNGMKILALSMIIALAGFAISSMNSEIKGQQSISENKMSPTPPKNDDDTLQPLKATFPVVRFSYESISDSTRLKKSCKYGKVAVLDPNVIGDSREVAITHWEQGLSPLPFDKSELVVVGSVLDAKAYLSENKGSVYSEFTIKVEKILKNLTRDSLSIGSKVAVERQGGVVEYPTGFKTWFLISGQGMPLPQRQYLFFLTNSFSDLVSKSTDLNVLTAYELRADGTVLPLDYPGGGTHPIAKFYKGKKVSTLLEDVNQFLKVPDKTVPEEER